MIKTLNHNNRALLYPQRLRHLYNIRWQILRIYHHTFDLNSFRLGILLLFLQLLIFDLWRNFILQLRDDMQLTILRKIEAMGHLLLTLGLNFCYQFGDLVILEMQDELLLLVEDLHLVQKVLLDEFAVFLNYGEVSGCEGF